MAKRFLIIITFLYAQYAFGQSTYLPIGTDNHYLLDRLETISGRLCDSLYLSNQPINRKNEIDFLNKIYPNLNAIKINALDSSAVKRAQMESSEWADSETSNTVSKHPILKYFYKHPYDLAQVSNKDFFLVVNPVFAGNGIIQRNTPGNNLYNKTLLSNTHGAEIRGRITKKLGFYTYFADNQEVFPSYIYKNVSNPRTMAVPGADYFLYTNNKNYYDYLQASGYVDFAAIKDHLNFTFGSGKHFIGDGLTSLFLSDYSANTPFLQVQVKVWKLNYECLYLELKPQYSKPLGDMVYNEKFATMQYLSYNAAKWLNLGFFEAVVFDRPNYYDVSYMNPVTLTFNINHYTGNGDKSKLGFFWKTIMAKHLQFYGQFMLDEFKSSEFLSHKGWWGNKWGLQIGGKYFNAFGLKNLDLQGEVNMVRPYTYTAKDTLANYTNYNQPLADPLGSGFIRGTGIAKLQASKNFAITGQIIYYIQGMDTGSSYFGNNIFNSYNLRNADYGVKIINGPQNKCSILELNMTYRVLPNLFLDCGATYRDYNSFDNKSGYTTTGPITGSLKTAYINFGIRLNAVKRNYNYY